jgi:hypothetical protein
MIIDRLEFYNAVKFIEHVIPDDEESGNNCLFVKIEFDKLILTGGGEYAAKRVPLVRPITVEEAAKESKDKSTSGTFMIPKGTLLAFESLLKSHKKKCKKLAKNDPSYLNIEISQKTLESNGVELTYDQPVFLFKDLNPLFEFKKDAVSETIISSPEMESVMKGFRKSKPVIVKMCGEDNPIYFMQEASGYEAILIPSPPEEPDDPGKDEEED